MGWFLRLAGGATFAELTSAALDPFARPPASASDGGTGVTLDATLANSFGSCPWRKEAVLA